MSLARKGKIVEKKTKEKMSKAKGTAVYLYAACLENYTHKFCLIKTFTSLRQAGKGLDISAGTVSRYIKSGLWFTKKNIKYKVSSASPKALD